jgi:hypothetical protein
MDRAQIERSLAASGFEDPDSRDSLIAIAEANGISAESLLFWLKDNVPGKEATLAAWRAWCATYCVLRVEAEAEDGSPGRVAPDAPECTRCWAGTLVIRKDGRAWCPTCGEICWCPTCSKAVK